MTDFDEVRVISTTPTGQVQIIKLSKEGDAYLGGNGQNGMLLLVPSSGNPENTIADPTVRIDSGGNLWLGGNGVNGKASLFPATAKNIAGVSHKSLVRVMLDAEGGNLWLGGNGKDGDLVIFHSKANDINDISQASIRLNGEVGKIDLGQSGSLGQVSRSILLDGSKGNIWLGAAESADAGTGGDLVIFPQRVTDTGDLKQATFHFDGGKGTLWLGGRPKGQLAEGIDGEIVIFPSTATDNHDSTQASIVMDGNKGIVRVTGDVRCGNADCAEEFDISESTTVDPGTVMVIDKEGKLQKSSKAYDKRVAGVVSGAGDCKPGIILDKKEMSLEKDKNRVPVALVGKVFCKVNAEYSQIKVGDLLTTSPTPGYAMKAANRAKAFGAVIGKALSSLKSGKGLIPILIALQ